ncbi:MAG TPA: sigma factor [Castellaniella sp.]|uniref:sigma factor n=1 Tax=Castellaniella sp. TaxID=1955812 RepID=UPI002EF12529
MSVSVFDYEAELTACAAGDRSAFLALFTQEAGPMFTLVQHMLGNEAEEVVHETFVLIWRNAAGYSASLGTARAWMYSILRYRALSHLHQLTASGEAREQPPLPVLNPQPDSGAIANTLASLPQPQLDALLQAYLHGGDYAHIAEKLDRSEPDIQASIESALARIDEAVRA